MRTRIPVGLGFAKILSTTSAALFSKGWGSDVNRGNLGAAMGALALWLGFQTLSTAGTLPEPAQMTVAPVVRLVAPGVISRRHRQSSVEPRDGAA